MGIGMASVDKIRVLIVDDSAFVRVMLSEIIARDPELELAGAAAGGRAALDQLSEIKPDVIVLDVEMPEMSGVETVSAIRARSPRLPVIMFSSYTEEGATVTIEALARGAADYVTKPTNVATPEEAVAAVRAQLLPKIKALAQRGRHFPMPTPAQPSQDDSGVIHPSPPPAIQLVCIAASTGGPNALETVLAPLPAGFPAALLIVQHMPPVFTQHLAQRLASRCAIRVREAVSGEPLQAGIALVAPGDHHLLVRNRGQAALVMTTRDPPENSCRPAADVLLRSAASAFGRHVLAVVLTGMGQDGLKGCEALCLAGGKIVVQDEASSVVWGMPGAVARAGLASKVVPLEKLTAEMVRRVQPSHAGPTRGVVRPSGHDTERDQSE